MVRVCCVCPCFAVLQEVGDFGGGDEGRLLVDRVEAAEEYIVDYGHHCSDFAGRRFGGALRIWGLAYELKGV